MSRSRVINLANFEQFTAINVLSDPGAVGGPVVIPNACQVVLNWNLSDAKTGHNVLYGSVGGGFTPTVALANAVFAALSTGGAWTALAGALANTGSFAGVSLRDVRTANQPIITSTAAAAPGTNANSALPLEVAIAVTLRTALSGAQNRGRMYMMGFATDALAVGNVINPGTITVVNAWVGTIAGALSGQGLTWSLGHKARQAYTGSTGTQHPARPAGLVPITSSTIRDNHWDSQRRRGLK